MKTKIPTAIALVALLSACPSDPESTTSDAGGEADMGMVEDSGGGTADSGADAGGDANVTPDMEVLPDGLSIPGLSGDVTVRFDERSVLHVECGTLHDCLAVQGYFHAAHRFVQMDVQRRYGSGRLAELIGSAALPTDIATRTLLSTASGQPLEEFVWENAAESTKDAVRAYTRGVNAWITDLREGRNGARLSEEYELELVDATIVDWTETDSIATGMLLVEQLSNTADGDIRNGRQFAQVSAETAFDVLGTMNGVGISAMDTSGETYTRALTARPNIGGIAEAQKRLRPHLSLLDRAAETLGAIDSAFGPSEQRGSNNWVIGGTRTTSGMPILANDPHLGLQNPTLWYLLEMRSEDGAHIAGASLPGLPGLQLGHNANIAWGATVLFHDLSDAYVERLNAAGTAVEFDGGEVDIVEVEHTFNVARSNPVTQTLRFVPHHGPIVAYDAASRAAISVRWTGHAVDEELDVFLELALAADIVEAEDALEKFGTTNMNWIVADTAGDIGWFPYTDIPQRPWASLEVAPWLPLPGDGSAEWGPKIPVAEQPRMFNPANGYIATANTDSIGSSFDGDPTNEPYGYLYSYGETGGFRQQDIVNQIEAIGNAHTAQDSIAIQGSNYLILSELILPSVRSVILANSNSLSPEAQTLWAALDGWDGTCPTGLATSDPEGAKNTDPDEAAASIGCTAMHYLVPALTEATFGDELAGSGASPAGLGPIRTLVVLMNDPVRLMAGPAYWDDVGTVDVVETRDETVLAGFETGASRIVASHGADPDEWRWGRLHMLRMFANVFSDAGFVQYEHELVAGPGGAFAINVANPRDPLGENWTYSAGPSFRHVSEFTADGIKSYWTLPGGQRHFRDSPHYDDLLEPWLNNEPFEMPFTAEAVEAAATETLTVSPR